MARENQKIKKCVWVLQFDNPNKPLEFYYETLLKKHKSFFNAEERIEIRKRLKIERSK